MEQVGVIGKRRKYHRKRQLVGHSALGICCCLLLCMGVWCLRGWIDDDNCSSYMIHSEIAEEIGDSYIDIGYEGLRVRRVIQALGRGDGIGMNGALYTEDVAAAVTEYQKNNGLQVDGTVGLETWKALGYTQEEWQLCGTYHSEIRSTERSSDKELIEIMIGRAMDYLGDPYVIGASGPAGAMYGVDCSGLVIQALYATGIDMETITPVTHARPGHEYESRNMWSVGQFKDIDTEKRKRGDLIFYQDISGTVNHVAIYLGDDQVIESWPDQVQISPMLDERHPVIKGVRRVFW